MRKARLERDVAITNAMADDLKDYLLKDILYWSMSDSGPRVDPYPQLTLGGLLVRLHHLSVLQGVLPPDAYESFSRARDKAESTFREWAVHLERKLLREIGARMRTWSLFLAECGDSPSACADEYPTQTEARTMIKFLFDHAEGVNGTGQLQGQMHGLDRRLQHLTTPAPFIWDDIFQQAYPPDPFWWLYVRPLSR